MSLSARARACRSSAAAGNRLIERRHRRRRQESRKRNSAGFTGEAPIPSGSGRNAFGGLGSKIGQRKSIGIGEIKTARECSVFPERS